MPPFINSFECLRVSMNEGIVVRGDYNDFDDGIHCQFYHERVQQYAYAMLGEEERIRLHHAIGMKLLQTVDSAGKKSQIEITLLCECSCRFSTMI